MSKKFYLSVPFEMDWDTLVAPFIEKYRKCLDLSWWQRRTKYYSKMLDEAVAIVVFIPDLEWECDNVDLPSGVRNELSRAINSNKELYIAYKTKSGVISFYKAEVKPYGIKGIPGTALLAPIGPTSPLKKFDEEVFRIDLPIQDKLVKEFQTHMADSMRYGTHIHKLMFEKGALDIETSSLKPVWCHSVAEKILGKWNVEKPRVLLAHGPHM